MDYGSIVYILAAVTFTGVLAGAAYTYMRAEKASSNRDS